MSFLSFRKERIYADAAAATPLTQVVKKELLRLEALYGNPDALHSEARAAKKELDAARKHTAEVLGALPDEIVFTSGGSEANNLAIQGSLQVFLEKGGKAHAVTTAIEHASILEPFDALKGRGLTCTKLPVDEQGLVSAKHLAEVIEPHTRLVSVQLINSEVGTIQPVREIAKEIRRIRKERAQENSQPLYFHCDASQAPWWMPLKRDHLGVDLMTLDAQKIGGPKGVGALVVRRGITLQPLIYGGSQEKGLRAGTSNVPLIGAFACALMDAQRDVVGRAVKVAAVRDFLFQELRQRIPEVVLNGPNFSHRVANNLNISIMGLDGEVAVIAMDKEGIAISTRSACDTDSEVPSHVLQALGISAQRARSAVRITLLPGATRAQGKRIAQSLQTIRQRYKTVV